MLKTSLNTSIKNIIDNALRQDNLTKLRGGEGNSQLVIDSEALSINDIPLGKEVCYDSASNAITPTIEYENISPFFLEGQRRCYYEHS